jgi:predicted ATPase
LLVAQTVASVFDLQESGATSPNELLRNYLRAKNLLLVVDNCEHLIQECAELADTLLRASSNLRILATSREALNIAGETTFRVPSLSVPDSQNRCPSNLCCNTNPFICLSKREGSTDRILIE